MQNCMHTIKCIHTPITSSYIYKIKWSICEGAYIIAYIILLYIKYIYIYNILVSDMVIKILLFLCMVCDCFSANSKGH